MENKDVRDIGLHGPQPDNHEAWSRISSPAIISVIHILILCQVVIGKNFTYFPFNNKGTSEILR